MYIGPWQEFGLAKLLRQREREIRAQERRWDTVQKQLKNHNHLNDMVDKTPGSGQSTNHDTVSGEICLPKIPPKCRKKQTKKSRQLERIGKMRKAYGIDEGRRPLSANVFGFDREECNSTPHQVLDRPRSITCLKASSRTIDQYDEPMDQEVDALLDWMQALEIP